MRRNTKQEVTGVVVNEKANISESSLKRFRALFFQIEKDGIESFGTKVEMYWRKSVVMPTSSIKGAIYINIA